MQEDDQEDYEELEDELDEYYLNLGLTLRPHVNTILSHRIAILGKPGSGKSNTVADLAEEIARLDPHPPLVIFDQKPEYGSLCDRPYFTNSLRANAENVTPHNAYEFGIWIMNNRAQVVLNLRSYKNDTTAAKVMIQILAAIWAWEERLPDDDRIPCTIFLDEAHYWFPQNEQLSTVNRQKDKNGYSIFTHLQQTFFSLVSGGRGMGMGCVISTQRPADIDNRVIALSDWRFLLNADMPNDLEVYKKLGMDPKGAPGLSNGEAYVRGPGGINGVYQLRRRYSPDESKTPGFEALRKPTPVYNYPDPIPTSGAPSLSDFRSETPPHRSPTLEYGISDAQTPENLKRLKQPVELSGPSETGNFFQVKGSETAQYPSESHLKQPVEPSEMAPRTPDKVKTYEQALISFRPDVDAVIAVILDLGSRGKPYDREDIKEALEWTNYKQPIIKVVCDKFQVAMPR